MDYFRYFYVQNITKELPEVITNEVIDNLIATQGSFLNWGFCWCDLSKNDLNSLDLKHLRLLSFNSSTIWPTKDKMPKGFDPKQILKDRRNPMLEIKKLHKRGITGKNVIVATIDSLPEKPNHIELKNANIEYVNLFNETDKHFHGDGILDNLCGKNVGVAPDIKVYHYSKPSGQNDNDSNRIIILQDILQKIKNGKKIKIVSISGELDKYPNPNPNPKEVKKLFKLKDEIEKLGCKVLYSSAFAEAGFGCGHIDYDKDYKNIDNIEISDFQ